TPFSHFLSTTTAPAGEAPPISKSFSIFAAAGGPDSSALARFMLQFLPKTKPGCRAVRASEAVAIMAPSSTMKVTWSLARLPSKPSCSSATRKQDRM
ncbi:MAG: hypothetical protein Q9173_007348, partial [Seirophora scorigena]